MPKRKTSGRDRAPSNPLAVYLAHAGRLLGGLFGFAPAKPRKAAEPEGKRRRTSAKPRPDVVAKTPRKAERVVKPRPEAEEPPAPPRPRRPGGAVKAADVFFNGEGEALLAIDPTGGDQPPRGKGARLSVLRGRVLIERPGGIAVVLPPLDAPTMARLQQARLVVVAESTGKAIVAEYPARFA